MKKVLQYIGGGLLVLSLVAVIAFIAINRNTAKASVADGQGYMSTTTTSAMASSTSIKQLKENGGQFGSVIIASSSPVTTYPLMVVYDATSTMATSTSRVLAKFGGNNQTHGTYTYDTDFKYGISIEMPVGFNGAYTVTYK